MMTTATFDYRKQLIDIFWDLECTIIVLFQTGLNIGLEEEWQDFKETIGDGDGIPIDLNYLRAIEHPSLKGIISMIEILVEAKNTLININQLSDEELLPTEGMFEMEPIDESEIEGSHYIEAWRQALFGYLMELYESIWILAFGGDPSDEIYDVFSDKYFEGGLEIDSKDENVLFLLDALNRVMITNARTNYYS